MAASMHSQKVKEGDKFMEEGEKCLKTGLFKWTPNHDGAAQAFSRAGLSYKMGKAYDKAEQAYVKSSDSYLEANSLFYSAKALEDAAGVCKESQKFDQAVNYLRQASHRYRENGNPDTAGMVIEKGAKTMEHSDPEKAAALYLEVASVHDSEEKYREATNSLRKALNMFIRSGKLPDAVKTANRLEHTYRQLQGWQNIHQVIAVKVLLHLHKGDIMEANQVYTEAFSVIGFDSSDEAAVIERLLGAFGDSDEEEIMKCTTDPVYKCMDNDVAKFAKSLKPQMMDLNMVRSPQSSTAKDKSSTTKDTSHPPPSLSTQEQSQHPGQDDDVTIDNKKLSEEDERAQLFSVTKRTTEKAELFKPTATTSGVSVQPEVTPKADNIAEELDEESDENEEILDIN